MIFQALEIKVLGSLKTRWFIPSALCFMLSLIGTELNAATLKEIDKRGTIRIGVKDNLPLLGQADPSGNLVGFEIELARKITRVIWGDRIAIEFIPLLNQDRLPAITSGEVDIAIANLHVTESRRRIVSFSQSYLTTQTSFVTQASLPPTLSSIKTRTIGVLQGSVAIGRLRSALPQTELLGLDSYSEAIDKLQSGEIDTFAGDALILRGWQYGSFAPQTPVQNQTVLPLFDPSAFRFSTNGLGVTPIAIAMPKGLQYKNLHDAIDLALEMLKTSGELQQMRNKWRLSLNQRSALDRLDAESERQGFFSVNLDLAPNVKKPSWINH